MSSQLVIRTCGHTLAIGRRCQGAAVHGRSCFRHHLDARARLHNMARARRALAVPRFRAFLTPADVAANRAEVIRLMANGSADFGTLRTLFWAMDLAAATFSAPQRRLSNSNVFYHVPAKPLFERCYPENLSEMLENIRGEGEGVHWANHTGTAYE
jgi:hypothetical protein